MDKSIYFGFEIDKDLNLLSFYLRGIWENSTYYLFDEAYTKHIDKMKEISGGIGFCLLVDLKEFFPKTKEIQEGIQRNMKYAVDSGVIRFAHLVENPIIDVMFRRLASKTKLEVWAHFTNEKDAMEWLYPN